LDIMFIVETKTKLNMGAEVFIIAILPRDCRKEAVYNCSLF